MYHEREKNRTGMQHMFANACVGVSVKLNLHTIVVSIKGAWKRQNIWATKPQAKTETLKQQW